MPGAQDLSTPKNGNYRYMSSNQIEQSFDSIESAYDFMNVLAETIMVVIKDLHRDYQIAVRDGQERRARAIELALFKAKTLNGYVTKSRRTLNDLRTIRRLILNERMSPEAVVAMAQAV
jgi:predicted methyltransferase